MPPETTGKPEWPVPHVPLVFRPGEGDTPASLARLPLRDRKRLLIVDDEPPVLVLEARILATDGYDIRCAESGVAALTLLDEPGADAVDLLVTDLRMPGMSGRDLAVAVRARYPGVRVLYQTGFADSLFAGLLELEAGEAFIEKPFSAEGLIEAVRLVMFGQIAGVAAPADPRDTMDWEDRRWRARFVRLLRRIGLA